MPRAARRTEEPARSEERRFHIAGPEVLAVGSASDPMDWRMRTAVRKTQPSGKSRRADGLPGVRNAAAAQPGHAALASLRGALDALLVFADRPAMLARDPLALVHAYSQPEDQEVAGLLIAMLAYGRVSAIQAKGREALALLGAHPATAILRGGWRRLEGLGYRFQRGADLARFMAGVAALRRAHGSVAEAFAEAVHGAGPAPDYAGAMTLLSDRLAACVPGPRPFTRGLRFLLPHPGTGGAAKRLALYLRWMVRPSDGIDLGTFARLGVRVDPGKLLVPLDTHVHRVAMTLGICRRKSADLRAAVEVTASLRSLRPADPLVYDLVLCHLGIGGLCPCRPSPSLCERCPLRRVCGT